MPVTRRILIGDTHRTMISMHARCFSDFLSSKCPWYLCNRLEDIRSKTLQSLQCARMVLEGFGVRWISIPRIIYI
jgi:hypothetical protein